MSEPRKILSRGKAGVAGPPGPDASVTSSNVLAAVQAMDATQKTTLLTALGIPTYAGDTAANDALAIGDVYRDSSDSNKLKSATR